MFLNYGNCITFFYKVTSLPRIQSWSDMGIVFWTICLAMFETSYCYYVVNPINQKIIFDTNIHEIKNIVEIAFWNHCCCRNWNYNIGIKIHHIGKQVVKINGISESIKKFKLIFNKKNKSSSFTRIHLIIIFYLILIIRSAFDISVLNNVIDNTFQFYYNQ